MLFNHQLPCHIVMMGAADYTTSDPVFALRRCNKVYGSDLAGLNRLFDTQVGDIQTVLDISSGYIQLYGLA